MLVPLTRDQPSYISNHCSSRHLTFFYFQPLPSFTEYYSYSYPVAPNRIRHLLSLSFLTIHVTILSLPHTGIKLYLSFVQPCWVLPPHHLNVCHFWQIISYQGISKIIRLKKKCKKTKGKAQFLKGTHLNIWLLKNVKTIGKTLAAAVLHCTVTTIPAVLMLKAN